jgi:hypothetical protein
MQVKNILSVAGALGLLTATVAAADDRPNVLFILTDDQDAHMSTLDYMPNVQKHIVEKGAKFERHYCTGLRVLYSKDCMFANSILQFLSAALAESTSGPAS